MSSRMAPPSGPPPRYTAIMQRMYPYNLRPVVIFTSLLGFIWAIAEGVTTLKSRGNANVTSQRQMYLLILSIMFFVVAGIELYGGAVACVAKLPLARLLNILAPVAVLVAVTSQLMTLILHFTLKSDILSQCVANTVGVVVTNSSGGNTTISNSQASTLCNNSWYQGIWTDVAWLVVTIVAALLFGMVAMAYYRQLLDPSLVRQRQSLAQLQSYQMQPPPQQHPNQFNNNQYTTQQPWMVPPYPGPPQPAPQNGFEKSDYHPDVEWASAGYAAPPGPPPQHSNPFEVRSEGGGGGSRVSPNREEDEAWERARSEGVTAHLTGHASPPPVLPEVGGGGRGGYTIHNDEEDEAWDKARREGVTAHLTGAGGGASARNGDK